MKKRAKKPTPRPAKASLSQTHKAPLIEHVHELRRRLFYIAACVAVGMAVAYGLEHKLIAALLRPSHGQSFIYTSPLGGMNFLFSVCLDIGLILATPVIIYQALAFIRPLMQNTTRRFLLFSSMTAGLVAIAGVLFGYFVGLPSALNFLLHQFATVQVRPLITIQSYMQFVALYLFGSALMFQLPLILFIINRIKPLKPSGLFKYERHLIVLAFITAFIMNPTPNIVDQMLVVVPIIIMYQLGIALIWFVNRGKDPQKLQELRLQDAERRAERTSRQLEPLIFGEILDISEPSPEPIVIPAESVAPSVTERPRSYARKITVTERRSYAPLRGQLVQ